MIRDATSFTPEGCIIPTSCTSGRRARAHRKFPAERSKTNRYSNWKMPSTSIATPNGMDATPTAVRE